MAKKEKKLSVDDLLKAAIIPESEQPYKVPENWCWTYLGHIAKWGSGGTPSRTNPNFYNGNIPWIKTGELNNDYIFDSEEKITEEAVQKSSAKLFPAESVLIAMYGATIGKTAILGITAATNQACACAITKDIIYNKYLFYYLLSQKDVFINKGKGGAQPNISQDIIKNHIIPLAPLAEQKRIIEQIEKLFVKLDETKVIIEEMMELHYLRKASILSRAFNGKLTSKWRDKRNIEFTSWKEYKLDDICTKITDGTHNSPKNYESGQYMYITAKNIKEKGIDLSNLTYVSEEDHKEIYTRCNVEFGDVLYIKDGATTGIATINNIKEPFSMLSSVALLKPNLNVINIKFLVYKLNSPETKSMMVNNMSGNAITRLTISKIKETIIWIPTIEEQNEIVKILDLILKKDQEVVEMVDIFDKIEIIKKSILTKAFRGELSTNCKSEPSSINLLKAY